MDGGAASFAPVPEHLANMRAFFGPIERAGLALARTPGGRWSDDEIVQLYRELDLIHCVAPFQRRLVDRPG